MCLQGNEGIQQGGIWTAGADLVESGTIESGYIGFDIPDAKVAMVLESRILPPFGGGIKGFICLDTALGEGYRECGVSTDPTTGFQSWPLPQLRGELYQVEIELDAEGAQSPTFSRWTLKAYPGVSTGIEISVPLIMSRKVTEKGIDLPYDPYEEYEFLEGLRQNQQVIQYVEGPFVRNGVIQSLDWLPNLEQVGGPYSGYDSYLMVYIQTLVYT
jgi:hypothetical protein